MGSIRIYPRYKLLVTYDIDADSDKHEEYYRFLLGEFVPKLQTMGLYMWRAFHTAYGDYPMRHLEFLAEDLDSVRNAITSEEWVELQEKLGHYVTNYHHKLVKFRDGFQF